MPYCTSKAIYTYLQSSEDNARAILQKLHYSFHNDSLIMRRDDHDMRYFGYWDNKLKGLVWGWESRTKAQNEETKTYTFDEWQSGIKYFLPLNDYIVFEPDEWNADTDSPRYSLYSQQQFQKMFEIKLRLKEL